MWLTDPLDNLWFDVGCNPQPLVNRECRIPAVATSHQSVKRDEQRVARSPIGSSPQQVSMGRNTNRRLNHRELKQAYADYWLAQKGKG